MIDVHCSCGAVYHAHEDFVGRSLQCNNPACRKILRIERPGIEPYIEPSSLLQEVVREQSIRERKTAHATEYERVRRDRRIGVGIIAVGIVSLFAWLLLRNPNSESPQPPAPAPGTASEPIATASAPHESPIPQYPELDLKPLKPLKPIPSLKMPPPMATIPLLKHPRPAPEFALPPCAVGQAPDRPQTGKRIEVNDGMSGECVLEVTNGRPMDATIRLVESPSNNTSRLVYIRAHDSYRIEQIAPGTYWLVFASGRDWVSPCAYFLRDEDIEEFVDPFVFEQTEEHNTIYKVTLHTVLNGNARTKKVDRKRFHQGDQRFSLQP